MDKLFLINISGQDKPGLTTSLTSILSAYQIRILDIGQAVIHDTLALGILIEASEEAVSSPVMTDLLLKAHELNVHIRFNAVTHEEYEVWAHAQSKQRYIITVLGRTITAEHLSRVSGIIAEHGLNIDRIDRLSGRKSLAASNGSSRACVEFTVSGQADAADEMHGAFLALTHEIDVDIAFQQDNVYRRSRRLVAFDMDSTLIQAEVIDELAKLAGVGDEVAKITEAAMRGELDFKQSFIRRLALLRGLPEGKLKRLADKIPLTDGAERLISTLKDLGYKTAILSGGFTFFGEHLKNRLGIDYVYANELEIADGLVTGNAGAEIVDGRRKAELLQELAARENISLDQVIAVGDGANDLPMLNIAGLGIAFHAKPLVKKNAKHSISNLGLDGILYLIGVRDRESGG